MHKENADTSAHTPRRTPLDRRLSELELTVPAPYVVENPQTLTTRKELSEWLEGLDRDDESALSEALLTQVKLLNRDPRRLEDRLQLMDLLLVPFTHLIRRIRAMNIGRPGERSRNEMVFSRLLGELSRETGFGYKRVLNELAADNLDACEDESLAHIIYWVCQCLTFDLMFAFTDYRPEPRGSWREMIRLYLLARRRKIARTPVSDPCAMPNTSPSIDLAFRRAAMVWILDPYNLRRGDVWSSYDYLSYHGRKVQVGTFRATDNTSGYFLVDMKGNLRPRPLRHDQPPERPREYLLLNVNPLNAVVHRHFRMLEINPEVEIEGLTNRDGTRTLHLFRSMLVHWHMSPNRRHQRIEEYDWLTVIYGLQNVAHHLANSDDALGATFLEVERAHALSEGLPQDLSGGRRSHRWRQTDFSPTGVGVVLPISEGRSIQIGQIVLTESERFRDHGRRHVGIVRRLIRRDDEHLEAGIQFLKGVVTPNHIHHRDRPIPILIVDRDRKDVQVLITPATVHRSGRVIEIKTGPQTAYTVRAGKLLETTCCIDRFEARRR